MKRPVLLTGMSCILALALGGCGLKGPLYLPDEARDVVTRPAPSSTPSAPSSPETVDAPDTPPSPAPEVTAPEGTAPTDPSQEKGKDEKNGKPPR